MLSKIGSFRKSNQSTSQLPSKKESGRFGQAVVDDQTNPRLVRRTSSKRCHSALEENNSAHNGESAACEYTQQQVKEKLEEQAERMQTHLADFVARLKSEHEEQLVALRAEMSGMEESYQQLLERADEMSKVVEEVTEENRKLKDKLRKSDDYVTFIQTEIRQ